MLVKMDKTIENSTPDQGAPPAKKPRLADTSGHISLTQVTTKADTGLIGGHSKPKAKPESSTMCLQPGVVRGTGAINLTISNGEIYTQSCTSRPIVTHAAVTQAVLATAATSTGTLATASGITFRPAVRPLSAGIRTGGIRPAGIPVSQFLVRADQLNAPTLLPLKVISSVGTRLPHTTTGTITVPVNNMLALQPGPRGSIALAPIMHPLSPGMIPTPPAAHQGGASKPVHITASQPMAAHMQRPTSLAMAGGLQRRPTLLPVITSTCTPIAAVPASGLLSTRPFVHAQVKQKTDLQSGPPPLQPIQDSSKITTFETKASIQVPAISSLTRDSASGITIISMSPSSVTTESKDTAKNITTVQAVSKNAGNTITAPKKSLPPGTETANSTLPDVQMTVVKADAVPTTDKAVLLDKTAELDCTSKKEGKADDDEKEKCSSKESEDAPKNLDENSLNDFDPMSIMDWKDGVGSLPGSNLKFRLNEFGLMEVITEDEANENENSSGEMKCTASSDRRTSTVTVSNSDLDLASRGICCCENCGMYGMISEFCKSGKFCSQACITAFEMKPRPADVASDDSVKKKKRKMTEDGDMNTINFKVKNRQDLKMTIRMPKSESPDLDTAGLDGISNGLQNLGKRVKGFSWKKYLEDEKGKAAPSKLFNESQLYPSQRNGFKVGMKMEAIDPQHQCLFCVVTVEEIRGFRLRLHFDSYSDCFDFWVNADSNEIFPPGWCEKNGHILQVPKTYTSESFTWAKYLKSSKCSAAPKHLFRIHNTPVSVVPSGFRISSKLEAVDKANTALICVATVADIYDNRFLVHFDGWEDAYDYWADAGSPYVHPVGWCQENDRALSPPNDWIDIKSFTWEKYLEETNSSAVPARAFKVRPPNAFGVGMKLEAVDRRNPILIRAATICDVEDYRVKLHFDGWSDIYDYWVEDDSPELHPAGWCTKTGHVLTPPISPQDLVEHVGQTGGCPTPGCKGIGHIRGAKYTGHHSAFGCPYSDVNISKMGIPVAERIVSTLPRDTPEKKEIQSEPKKCPTSGCDGSGHVTGKFTNHFSVSGCPNVEKAHTQSPVLPVRGRPGRRKKRHLLLLARKIKREQQVSGSSESQDSRQSQMNNFVHDSVFLPPVSAHPRTDLPLGWDEHSKLLPELNGFKKDEVTGWSLDDVCKFIRKLPGCAEHAVAFKDEQIDGEALLLLTQADIIKLLNVKLGPAIKIYSSILLLRGVTSNTAESR